MLVTPMLVRLAQVKLMLHSPARCPECFHSSLCFPSSLQGALKIICCILNCIAQVGAGPGR